MRFVSLFAGIGGIDLGLERAGMTCVAQVENDPWCTQVLEKHWPDTPRWQDIHDLDPKELPDHDLIAGGFPCQPVSTAGKRLAQDDPRWLWPGFGRVVRVVRPRYVLVENVPGLLTAGFDDVQADLAAYGYDTEWARISAADVGAPHLRQRIFLVAYPGSDQLRDESGRSSGSGRAGASVFGDNGASQSVARWTPPSAQHTKGRITHWETEPDVGRVADGVPSRVDRLRGLGNAVVPQVAETVGRLIMETAS